MRILALLAMVLAVALAACGGSSATPTPAPIGGDVMAPLILDATTTMGTIKVNQVVVFDVDDPTSWSLTADKPELVELIPGTDDGSSVGNPGAKGLKAGEVRIGLENGSQSLVYTITILE
jgi:hypothetical protein